jgi:hypothetical protein
MKPERVEDEHTAGNVPFSNSDFSRSGMANEQSSMLSLNVEIMQDNKKLIPNYAAI